MNTPAPSPAPSPPDAGWSILGRLSRAVLAMVALGWIATIALTLWDIQREMDEALDEEMVLVAQSVILALDAEAGPPIPRIVTLSPEADERILRIISPGSTPPDAPWHALTEDGVSEDAGWRVLRHSGDRAVVEVGHSRAWRREEVLEAASALLVFVLPLVALLLWGIRRTLGQTLAPVVAVARGIGARKADDLSPIAAEILPRELQPLAQALNTYLSRIETMRLAERRFAANAAHELRTPIAAIRAQMEQQGAAGPSLRLLDDLTRRVERLLQLSRSEAGLGLGHGPADLVQITRLVIEDIRRSPSPTSGPTASETSAPPILFDDGDCESLMVDHDPDALAIIIRNLIDNARDHGTGPVRVLLDHTARLVVENPTDQTAFAEAAFAKGAASRGIGLGLSIVATLAGAMGISVQKSITQGVARVELRFR